MIVSKKFSDKTGIHFTGYFDEMNTGFIGKIDGTDKLFGRLKINLLRATNSSLLPII